jgi:hypothetical protein
LEAEREPEGKEARDSPVLRQHNKIPTEKIKTTFSFIFEMPSPIEGFKPENLLIWSASPDVHGNLHIADGNTLCLGSVLPAFACHLQPCRNSTMFIKRVSLSCDRWSFR